MDQIVQLWLCAKQGNTHAFDSGAPPSPPSRARFAFLRSAWEHIRESVLIVPIMTTTAHLPYK
jgi:hypothetical protein